MELLVGTELLDILVPELARGLRGDAPDEENTVRRSRLWGYLGALDRQSSRRPTAPSNALILAVLTLPPLRDVLDPDSTGVRDVGPIVAQAISPVMERLKASRRDAELTRQMLLALRYVLPSKRPNRRRPRLAGRDFLDDALRLAELVSDAEAVDAALAGRPIIEVNGAETLRQGDGDGDPVAAALLDGAAAPAGEEFSEDALPPELESTWTVIGTDGADEDAAILAVSMSRGTPGGRVRLHRLTRSGPHSRTAPVGGRSTCPRRGCPRCRRVRQRRCR